MVELTEQQAMEVFESGFWKDLTDDEIVKFQLFTERLCMPFSIFAEAVERVLGRSVYTHEFGRKNVENLKNEYLGEKEPPTVEEIVELLPKNKTIFILV